MNKTTSFHNICLAILHILRHEEGYTSAKIADFFQKNPQDWAKIETGETALSLEIMHRWCLMLGVQLSELIFAAECYKSWLEKGMLSPLHTGPRWSVVHTPLNHKQDDLLQYLNHSDRLYSPEITAQINPQRSILDNLPQRGSNNIIIFPHPFFKEASGKKLLSGPRTSQTLNRTENTPLT